METTLIFQIMYWNYISGIYTSTLIVEDEKGETISNNSVRRISPRLWDSRRKDK